MNSKIGKSSSLPKLKTQFTQKDYNKIRLPHSSSLYSEFHYKISLKDIQKMIHNKHVLVISNLQRLRDEQKQKIRMQQQQIMGYKLTEQKHLNKIAEYQKETKQFVNKKIEKVQIEVDQLAKDIGGIQKTQMSKFRQQCLKILDRFNAIKNNFSMEQVDNLLNQVIHETIRKSFSCQKVSQQTIFKLQALNFNQQQKIGMLQKQCELSHTKFKQLQNKIQVLNKQLQKYRPYKQKYNQQKVLCSQLKIQNDELLKKYDILQQWKNNKIKDQNIAKQVQQKYITSFNQFSGQLNITGQNSVQQMLKETLEIQQEYKKLDIKNLQIIFKEKVCFVIHLFKKFQYKSRQKIEKLQQKIAFLTHELDTQGIFIERQAKFIRQKSKQLKQNKNEKIQNVRNSYKRLQGISMGKISEKSKKFLKL